LLPPDYSSAAEKPTTTMLAMATTMEDAQGDPPAIQTNDWSALIAKSRKHTGGSRWGEPPIVVGTVMVVLFLASFALNAITAAHVLSDGVDAVCVDEVASWAYADVDLAAPPANLVLVLDGGMHRAFDGYDGATAPPCMAQLHRTLAARGLRLYAMTPAAAPNATRAAVPRVGVCHHPPCA
jgi:hypothetical protein